MYDATVDFNVIVTDRILHSNLHAHSKSVYTWDGNDI